MFTTFTTFSILKSVKILSGNETGCENFDLEEYYSDKCVKYKLQLINITTRILFNYNGS